MPGNDLSLRAKIEDCLCSNESAKGLDDFSCSFLHFQMFSYSSAADGFASRQSGKQDATQVSSAIPSPLGGLWGYKVDNLGGRWQRPHLSLSPTPRWSGSVRAAHQRSQPEGSQDTRGLCRSRVERFVSTAAQCGQGAVTLCCIVLTIVQFQTETDALRSIFIGLKALQFQGFQRQEQRRKRSVLSEIGQKQLPVPLGRLCPFEHHL